MLYIIKNISNDNIVVGKSALRPGMEIKTHDLEPFKKMIEKGYLTVKDVKDMNEEIYTNYIRAVNPEPVKASSIPEITVVVDSPGQIASNTITQPEIKDKFVADAMKQNIMEAFFSFYIMKNVSEKELKMLKWFYKNIGITKDVSSEILDLLEQAEDYEELTTVLLNNVYPRLLEIYLIEKEETDKKEKLAY